MKKFFNHPYYLIFGFLLSSLGGIAQQDFVQSQYMFNLLSINPAYAGSKNTFDVNFSHRSQWSGLEGAPTTQVLSLHAPLFQQKVGLGLQIINDEIGPRKITGLSIPYAYHLRMGKGKLGLGLRSGLYNYTYNWAMLNYKEKEDVVIGQGKQSKVVADFDFGIYYKDRLNYVGVQLAHLNEARIYDNDSLKENPAHLYASLSLFYGHAFELKENLVLKTSVLARTVAGAFYADINASVLFKKRFWFGASYKTVGIASFITKINATQKLSVGYSFDYPIANVFLQRTSNEIFIQYSFKRFKNEGVSPRYF